MENALLVGDTALHLAFYETDIEDESVAHYTRHCDSKGGGCLDEPWLGDY